MSKQKLSKSKPEINPGSKLRVLAVTTTIDCLNDLNLFLASSRADTDNFQYSDVDFKNN